MYIYFYSRRHISIYFRVRSCHLSLKFRSLSIKMSKDRFSLPTSFPRNFIFEIQEKKCDLSQWRGSFCKKKSIRLVWRSVACTSVRHLPVQVSAIKGSPRVSPSTCDNEPFNGALARSRSWKLGQRPGHQWTGRIEGITFLTRWNATNEIIFFVGSSPLWSIYRP